MKRILTYLVVFIGFVLSAHGQQLNNQFESQSACNARPLCGATITTPYSFTTTAPFNVNPIGTCVSNSGGTFSYSASGNWVYYRFTCYSTGIFNFRLVPLDTATTNSNLNWAVWDITTSGCNSLTTANTVECNASVTVGATGIQTGGLPATNFEPNVTLTAGSTYILGISNSSLTGNHLGFTITFGGTTAGIVDNKKPFLASMVPFDPCSPVSTFKVKLSEPVRCNQLGVGADFTIAPSTPSFTVTPGSNCPGGVNAAPNTAPNFGNTSDTATFTFASNLAPGSYTITPLANAFFDLCANSDSTQRTLVFTVPAPFKDSVRTGFDCVNMKYIDTVYGVNGLSPYQYKGVGGGLPAAAGNWSAAQPGPMIYSVSGGSAVTYSVKDAGGCTVDTTITRPSVLSLGAPNLSLSYSPPCHDQFSLDSITVSSISGGMPPYTFSMAPVVSWTFVAPNTWKNIVFPGLGTSFTITATDALGCTRTGVKNLVNPTVVTLNLPTPTNPLCFGDSSGKICGFNATGGTPGSPLYTYSIAPNYAPMTFTTAPNCFNNMPAGSYTVIATDANGCTASSTKTMSQPGQFSINPLSAKTNPTCPANCDGTFTPTPINGAGAKKYYLYPFIGTNGPWHYSDSVVSTIAPNNDFDSLCPGTYTIIARDANGCTTTFSFTLAYPASPVMNIVTVNPVPCYGGTGSIAVNITSPTTPYTAANYLYSPSPITGVTVTTSGVGGVNATYAGLPAGTYTLVIRNNNLCADTEVVAMTQPPSPLTYSSVTADSVLCFGTATGNITVQAGGGTVGPNAYQYAIKVGAAPFSAFTAATLTPYTFTNLGANTYTIRARDQNNCTKDTVVTVFQPTKLDLLLNSVNTTCFGTANGQICVLDTGGTPGYQYKLGVAGLYGPVQPAGLPQCFGSLTAGSYSIFTKDAKGCLDTLVSTVASIALPVVSFTTSPNDSVCDGSPVTLCGTGATSYAWTGGVTDCTAFVPVLGSSTYTVTGTNSATGCTNTAVATLQVNPVPVLNPIANQVVCNNAVTAAVNFSTTVPIVGATYSWSHNAPGCGLPVSGNGNIPAFTAINTGSTPLVVTFTVIPKGPSTTFCVGNSANFTITINPTPILTDPADQVICAGNNTADVIFVSSVTPTSFSWTNNNNTTGLGQFSGTGDILSFVGLNPGNTPNISVITVTPAANGCAGASQTFSITVNPIPDVNPPANQVVCNGLPTTAVGFIGSVASTTFSWTNNNPAIGLPASGTGNIPAFNAINTGNTPVVATICVTPSGPVPTNCVGATQCFTITVNPTPGITANADQTLCAGDATNAIVFGSNVGTTTFTWTNSNTGIGLGASSGGPVLSIPSFNATNGGTAPISGTIIVSTSASGCVGAKDTFVITVNPIPVANPVANQVVCNNENTTAINFSSAVAGTTFDWSYTASSNIGLPTTGTGNIAAFTAINTGTTPIVATFTVEPTGPGTTFCEGNDITFTITVLPRQNPSFTYSPGTYCQTGTNPVPTFGAGATPGGAFSYTGAGTLSINPVTGVINLLSSNLGSYTVKYTTPGPCPDSATFVITITNAPDATFSYALTHYCQNAPVNPLPVFAPGASAGVFSAIPAGLNFVNVNSGEINLASSNAGTYTVRNIIAAAGGCAADTATFTVTIDSMVVLSDPADQVVCNNTATAAVNFTLSIPATVSWSHNATAAIGCPVSGTGNIPSFTAVNTGTTPIVVTFTATPTTLAPNNCLGLSQSFTITINPTPILTDPADQVICAGDNTADVIFVSSVTPTSFSWTNNNNTTGLGQFSGTGDILSFVGLNPGNTPNISVITVTPAANGCAGASQTFSITVNPIPDVNPPANQVVCNGLPTTAVNFLGSVTSTTFSWTNTNPAIGLPASGTGNIPSFIGICGGNTPVTATICVTPTGPAPTNCVGATQCFTLTVNPTPGITANTDQELCAGDGTNPVVFASNVATTTFTWTNSNTGIGLGASSGGPVLSIPSFTATNPGTAPIIGTIIVSTSASGCAGAKDTFLIKVNPLPAVNAVANQVVCDNENTTAITFGSPVTGATFDWSYSASSNIGLPTTGSNTIPAFTAVNTGTTPIVATFTVTPTGPGSTFCAGTDLTFTITVLPRQNPSFTYNPSTFCQTGTNPLPVFGAGAATGGVFSYTGAGTLSLNPVTGQIILLTSAIGTYTVKYVTPGPCPDSTTFNVTITNAPDATFSYANTHYCQGGAVNPVPTFPPGSSAGVFSALPAGLNFVNVNTGEINLANSNAGTYTVRNIIAAAGGCSADTATFTVTIDSMVVLTDPADQVVCNGAFTTAVNFVTSIPGSVTWSHNATAAIGCPVSGNGNIPAFNAVNTGITPVVVTFTATATTPAPNNCAGLSQSFTITINPTPDVTDPINQTVCNGAATTAINFVSSVNPGTTFTWTNSTPAIGIGAGPTTGNLPSFNAVNTGSTPVTATFTVTPVASGCSGAPQTFDIVVNPDAKLNLTSAAATTNQIVCRNSPITNITYAVAGTGNASSVAGLPPGVTATSGMNPTISGTPNTAGSYTYTVTATGTCGPATATGTIQVTPLQDPTFFYPNPTNCKFGTTAPNIINTPGGTFSATPAGLVFMGAPNPNGTINLAASAVGTYTVKYVTPGPCKDSTTLIINVANAPCADFSYGAATYCQSAANPSPIYAPTCSPGTFSSIPAGVVFTTPAGTINLLASTPGVYQIINTIAPSGPCPGVADTVNVTITSKPVPAFVSSVPAGCNPNCNGKVNINTTGGTGAGTYSYAISGGAAIASTGASTAQATNLCASTIYTITVTDATGCTGTITVSVATATPPSVSFVSSVPAGCNPNCNGIVNVSASGGTGAGTYSYTVTGSASASITSTGASTAQATGLCAGTTYTIKVTDASGCTGTMTATVTTTPSPTVTATSINTTAPGANNGTAQATGAGGTPGYTYSISGPGAPVINPVTGAASNLNGGDPNCVTYTITVTDSKGCTGTTTVCIYDPGALLCNQTHVNVSCFGGNNGSLTSTVSGGTAPYTLVSANGPSGAISFTPAVPVNTISASGLPAGVYTITWKDAVNIQCQSVINITQPAKLNFTIPVINTPSCATPPACDGTLSISSTGGTNPKTYQITSPAGSTCVITQATPGNFSGLGVGTYTVKVTDSNLCTKDTVITISYQIPTLALAHVNPTCANLCNGSISAVGAGGAGPLAYAITSPPAAVCVPAQLTSGNFTSLGGGTYTVVVTDTKGCNKQDTTTLVAPPAIVWDSVVNTTPLCNGGNNGSIHAYGHGGVGALGYTMTPPSGPPVSNATGLFNGLTAGTYTVSVHDANCSITTTVVVTQPSALIWSIAISNNITCAGSANGIINVTATGGTGTKVYSKNGVTFVPSGSFGSLLAGTYTITAKDANGCTLTTSFTIAEPPPLTLTAPVVQNVLCNGGNTGSISITANGGTPASTGYSYSITPLPATNTTGVFGNLTAGTYTITVTDSAGCTKSSAGILVTQPAPLVYTLTNHQDVACFGDTTGTITVNTQGGTPPVTYSLLPNVGTQGPSGFFSGLPAGTYVVSGVDAHGCSTATSVTLNQGPEIIFLNVTMNEPVCHGDANGSISLTVIGGTGQLKYKINGGPLQTDTVFSNLVAGNYLVTVVDALGCSKNTAVTVTEPDPVGAIVNVEGTNCIDSKDGKAIIIGTGGRGGYKYYLTPGLHINKSGIFVGLEAGSYLLRVVDTSGCEYRTNITILPPANPLNVVITKQDLACNGVGNEGSATANAAGGLPPYTYLWSTNPPQTTPKASTLYFGYYNVMIADANGCVIRDTVYIEEGPCCDIAFIPNAFSPNGDQVNDEFRVLTTAGVELIQLEIYDRWGKRVWGTIDYRKGWDGTIDGKAASVDTYYYIFRYKCTRDNLTYTKKGDVILIR